MRVRWFPRQADIGNIWPVTYAADEANAETLMCTAESPQTGNKWRPRLAINLTEDNQANAVNYHSET
jgi:hypothetical protein